MNVRYIFKSIVPLIFFFVIPLSGYLLLAQNAPKTQVVEVDGLSGLLDKQLPFDRNFYLKIKVKKDVEYKRVLIARDFKKVTNVRSIEQKIKQYDNRKKLLPLESVRYLDFKTEMIKGDNDYKFLVVLCPPLPPNIKYEFILTNKYSSSQMLELFKLFDLINQNADLKLKNWIKKNEKSFWLYPDYNKIDEKIRETYKAVVNDYNATIVDFRENDSVNNRYLKFYNRIIDKDIVNCSPLKGNEKKSCNDNNKILLDTNTTKIVKQYLKFLTGVCVQKNTEELREGVICSSQSPYNLSTYITFHDSLYQKFLNDLDTLHLEITNNLMILSNNDVLDKIASLALDYRAKQRRTNDFETTLKVLSNFKTLKKDSIVEVLKGRGRINGELSAKYKPNFDYISAQANNSLNIIAITRLVDDLKSLLLFYPMNERDLKSSLNESLKILMALKSQKDVLDEGVSMIRDLEAHIVDKNVFGNTQFEKISTEAGKWILPDAGLLLAFSKESSVLRPFLGVNINFGPVDKDVRTRFMPKLNEENVPYMNRTLRYLRQHTSLMLGITLGSIRIDDTRDDLFGGVNIATGLGFRINRAIRLSSGTLWYNQINPNPVLSGKKIKALGYFSVSFDIEFQKATQNNLSKVFK